MSGTCGLHNRIHFDGGSVADGPERFADARSFGLSDLTLEESDAIRFQSRSDFGIRELVEKMRPAVIKESLGPYASNHSILFGFEFPEIFNPDICQADEAELKKMFFEP